MKLRIVVSLALALAASAVPGRAGTHTWNGKLNALWNNPGNWDEGLAPTAGESPVAIVIPVNPARPASYNNVAGLVVDSIAFKGSHASINGNNAITLRGPALISILVSGQSNVISTPLTLTAQHTFSVGSSASLELSGEIKGNGGITKMARGSLTLAGTSANTYTGRTEFRGDGGTLHLNKGGDLFDAVAIPGDFTLGDADQNDFPVSVIFHRSHQIADPARVFVGPNCTLALNGNDDAFTELTIVRGAVTTPSLTGPAAPGNLTLLGDLTVSNSTQNLPASISGTMTMTAADRTIAVQGDSVLEVNAAIQDGVGAGNLSKVGSGTLRLAGFNTFHGRVYVNDGVLDVTHGKALGATSLGTYVKSGATLRLSGVNVANEHLYLNGSGPGGLIGAEFGALEVKSANAIWSGPITLESTSTIAVADGRTLNLSGVIDGAGDVAFVGLGTVGIDGPSANTYTGATYAHGGLLTLGKTMWQPAVPGSFFVGQPHPLANSQVIPHTNVVRLLASEQLPLALPVQLDVTGVFDLNGYQQTVGSLTMFGSVITNSGAGILILAGDVTGTSLWNNYPTIYGEVSLGGRDRAFTSLTPGAIELEGNLRDGGNPAGILKQGPFGLRLDGTNSTYRGVTDVQEGWLSAEQPGSLGSPLGGTTVASNAWFYVGLNYHGPSDILTLKDKSWFASVGNNSWDGDIVLLGDARIVVDNAANNESLDLNGSISGPGGLTVEQGGALRLGGAVANTYAGPTVVLGTDQWLAVRPTVLELRKPNGVVAVPGPLIIGSATNAPAHETVRLFARGQIGDASSVVVNASGLLDLNDKDETIGSLAGSGLVDLRLGALTNGGNNASTVFSGTIAGTSFAAQFCKEGNGSLALTGTNTLSGSMMINNGHLYANGQQNSSIFVSPHGHLHGQGAVGFLTGLGGRTVPGDNISAPFHGRLKSKSVTLDAASSFNIDLGGKIEGVDYDQLEVSGTVKLGGATFYLTQSFAGSVSNQFVIIRNDGVDAVQGTFAFLPEGATATINGAQFKISYQGGDGNDVVLTQLTATPGAKLGRISRLPGGGIEISGTGIPSLTYDVEAIGDLTTTNWISIGHAVGESGGALSFVDPDAPKHAQRFYRFVLP